MSFLSKLINNYYFDVSDKALFDELIIPCDYAGVNYEESYWTIEPCETETVIDYTLPGVEKSQLSVRVEQEEQESVLIVEIYERPGGGVGSRAKTAKFHFFPGEIPEKTSSELKNGVLTLRIPKEPDAKPAKKTVLSIPVG